MINYGLDEEQVEAIQWAIKTVDNLIDTMEENMKDDAYRLESKRTGVEYQKTLRARMELRQERLNKAKRNREALQGLIVTEKI